MTLTESATLAKDATFRDRVQAAAVGQALLVMGEAPDPKNRLAEKRQKLAAAVIEDGGIAMLNRFAWGLASYPSFPTAATDAQIVTFVTSGWNKLAEVTGSELAS